MHLQHSTTTAVNSQDGGENPFLDFFNDSKENNTVHTVNSINTNNNTSLNTFDIFGDIFSNNYGTPISPLNGNNTSNDTSNINPIINGTTLEHHGVSFQSDIKNDYDITNNNNINSNNITKNELKLKTLSTDIKTIENEIKSLKKVIQDREKKLREIKTKYFDLRMEIENQKKSQLLKTNNNLYGNKILNEGNEYEYYSSNNEMSYTNEISIGTFKQNTKVLNNKGINIKNYNKTLEGSLYHYNGETIDSINFNRPLKSKYLVYIPLKKMLFYSDDLNSNLDGWNQIDCKMFLIDNITDSNTTIEQNLKQRYKQTYFVLYSGTINKVIMLFCGDNSIEKDIWYNTINKSLITKFSQNDIKKHGIIEGYLHKFQGTTEFNIKYDEKFKKSRIKYVIYSCDVNALFYTDKKRNHSESVIVKPTDVTTKVSNPRINQNMKKVFKDSWFKVATKDRIIVFGCNDFEEATNWYNAISKGITAFAK